MLRAEGTDMHEKIYSERTTRYAVRFQHLCIALSVMMASISATRAQDAPYPSKLVRFIVGQAPGGATDIVGRMVAAKLTDTLGQNFLVENRTGAAGSIAAAAVAKSPPDGYTILVVSSSYSINPSLNISLPFDPQKDLAAVSLLAEAPFLLVVHPSVPAKNVKDLIALANSKRATLTYGSGGNGSSGHLAGALFESAAGVKLAHIPYKGAGQALIDVVAGQITCVFGSVLSSTPHVNQGRLRVLAVTGTKRTAALPNAPTVAEAGVRNYSASTWYGLLAPGGSPRAIIDRLSVEASKAIMSGELKSRLLTDGAEPVGSNPSTFQKHIAVEIDKWRKVIKAAGVSSD
jgi:tripartite-type tricarboxylate transporter receptor subunit TctC